MDKPPEIIITQDGSSSVMCGIHGVTYHSKYGAIQESKHVFINAALLPQLRVKNSISILEMGFGTGLNTLLTLQNTDKNKVFYTTLESNPLVEKDWKKLNYPSLIDSKLEKDFQQIHQSNWGVKSTINSNFELLKLNTNLEDWAPTDKYDIIYFDAFAPTSQPELWTKEIFQKLFNTLHPNGVLVTYCAKGVVKRTLKEVGFTVESIPGPPGKREMTRGIRVV